MERYACDLSTVSIQSHNFENYKSYELFKRVGLRLHSTIILVPGQLEDTMSPRWLASLLPPLTLGSPSRRYSLWGRGRLRAAAAVTFRVLMLVGMLCAPVPILRIAGFADPNASDGGASLGSLSDC